MNAALLRNAFAAHIAGDLSKAATVYRYLLESEPSHAEAWHLLGDVLAKSGDIDAAFDALNKAISFNDTYAEARNTLGSLLMDQGRFTEAEIQFQKAGELMPEFAEAWTNLGESRRRQGNPMSAIEPSERALQLKPTLAVVHNNLGAIHKDLGDLSRAGALFERAIELDDTLIFARLNLANIYRLDGQLNIALAIAESVLNILPDANTAWNVLGAIKLDLDDIEGAQNAIKKALVLNPNSADSHCNLGNIRLRLGEVRTAISDYKCALTHNPDHLDAMVNLGTALQTEGGTRDAIAHFDKVLARRPDHVDARWNRALALLADGNYREGFAEYEGRWQLPNRKYRDLDRSAWNGTNIAGQRILVWTEQGYGDTLQFARFLPVLGQRGATVLVESHATLLPLLANVDGVSVCFEYGAPLPSYHCHVPLMSLPHLLGIDLQNLPTEVPYLTPPADRQAPKRISRSTGLKVGLVWQGRQTRKNFLGRHCPLAALAPLTAIAGVSLFSLQVDNAVDELAKYGWGRHISNIGEEFTDFADTAAAMGAMDLVITIDTAAAHLAGALGIKVWTLLSPYADWRWMRVLNDNVWYPTMRLFRQTKVGAWDELIQRVADELRRYAAVNTPRR